MNNKFEGSLLFRFKGEVIDELLNDLKALANKSNNKETLVSFNILKNAKWLTHPCALSSEYTIYSIYDINGDIITFVDPDENENLSEKDKIDFKSRLRQHPFMGYEFAISISATNYLEGFDFGKALVEYFKPYVDITLYDSKYHGFMGSINNQDFSYYKDFFIDENYNPISEERRPICSGCHYAYESTTCPNYDLCLRAYNRGKQSAMIKESK